MNADSDVEDNELLEISPLEADVEFGKDIIWSERNLQKFRLKNKLPNILSNYNCSFL